MTEAEWLNATNTRPMLDFLRQRACERQLRLFGCALCRSVWNYLKSDERCWQAVEIAERYADGEVSAEDLTVARGAVETARREVRDKAQGTGGSPTREALMGRLWAVTLAAALVDTRDVLWDVLRTLVFPEIIPHIRDIFGNPFRPVMLDPGLLSWSVVAVAQAAYEHRTLPLGTLEPERLGILADALEDAGCTDATILEHLRGPGKHVRGCFVVDLLLGKK